MYFQLWWFRRKNDNYSVREAGVSRQSGRPNWGHPSWNPLGPSQHSIVLRNLMGAVNRSPIMPREASLRSTSLKTILQQKRLVSASHWNPSNATHFNRRILTRIARAILGKIHWKSQPHHQPRETEVSRHHGAQIKGLPETPRTWQHYHIEGFKG